MLLPRDSIFAFAVAVAACAAPRPRRALTPPVAPETIDPSGEWEVRWDRTFAGWSPIFDGMLVLTHTGPKWNATLAFENSGWKFQFQSLRIDGDHVTLDFTNSDGPVTIDGWIREKRFVGEMRSKTIDWTPFAGHRVEYPKLVFAHANQSLPTLERDRTMSNAARDTLLDEARKERSSAIVIVKDGQITLEAYRDGYAGEPLLAMSASKSIASLAVGLLVADGKLTLDTRMDSIFPEWKNLGAKSGITVRQLLSHTSGLDPTRASFQTGETIREHVLRSPLVFKPGTRFQYNNNAADFVAVVVAQVARMPLDAFLKARLFDALEMLDVSWMKDSEGTPRAAGELVIRPVDLAKIGQLMLDEGRWKGAQLVSADWIRISTRPSQSLEESCGLLWWVEGSFSFALTEPVLDAWRDRHVDDATIQQARGLLGQRFPTREAYRKAIASRLGPAAADRIDAALKGANHIDVATHVSDGPVRGFSARGSLGQFLVVYPKARVVAVRMRASGPRDQAGGPERNGFRHFADDVAELYPQQ